MAARVAVVDRDPATGFLARPVPWMEHQRRFDCPRDITAPAATAVSAFGLVLKTISVYEREDVLGHKVQWGFDAPQLLLVPRAGTWANAFYDRYSTSLQFFSFDAPDGSEVRTALSRDIVTHECGHAILDGLARALYDALSPQTLGLHEAIGDLTAVCMALESGTIRKWLVKNRQGGLYGSTPASELANEFGEALQRHRPLRDVHNDLKLSDVDQQEPHELSQVLTGAVWKAMDKLHKYSMKDAMNEAPSGKEESVESRALGISARRIARLLFRALDYLPPAEATFADYARAVIASDRVAYRDDESGYRSTLATEFKKRGIPGDLDAAVSGESLKVDLDDLLESDWAAYKFVDDHRRLLRMPAKGAFRVFPRREANRRYYVTGGGHEVRREVALQVTWEEPEANEGVFSVPGARAVFKGTTLVLGGAPQRGRYPVLSVLTTDAGTEHIEARNEALRRLADEGKLLFASRWEANNLRPLAPLVFARTAQGVLRLRGTARLLHIADAY